MTTNDRGAGGAGSIATDLANEPGQQQDPGAGGQQQPPAGGQANEGAGAAGNTPAGLPNWTTSASKETRADPRFAAYASKHKTLDEALKASIDLEEKIGSMVAIPGENATEEERAAVLEKLGVKAPEIPKTPSEYALTAAEGMTVDAAEVEEYKALAHSLKLTQDQAQQMFKLAGERAIKATEAYNAKIATDKAAVEAELKKEWGADYEGQRAIFARGLKAAPNYKQLLADATETQMGNKASFVRLMHWVGSMSLEDHVGGGPGGPVKESPADILYPNQGRK